MMAPMTAEEDLGKARLWRLVRIVALGTVLLFSTGVTIGLIAAHFARDGGASTRFLMILAGAAILVLGAGWLLLRETRRATGEAPLTRKERLNRNILLGSGLLGGVMGVVMVLASRTSDPWAVFSDAPLPPVLALAFVVILGVVLPILSIYWQKAAVDELEVDAYKTGALYALYVYMIAAPIWWFAWRGGFAPEPSGVALYFLTIFTMLIVWLGKKYG